MVVVSTGTCMTRTVHKRPGRRTGWHTPRPSGRTPHSTVAYLGPAETYDGPGLRRLRGDRQSGSHTTSRRVPICDTVSDPYDRRGDGACARAAGAAPRPPLYSTWCDAPSPVGPSSRAT